jgi:hypothetical protein
MDENPYESTAHGGGFRKTQATRWLVWSGVVSLVLSVACLVATVAGMMASFRTMAEASAAPRAEDLARSISYALVPGYAIVPLALLGVILVVLGFVNRRPIRH